MAIARRCIALDPESDRFDGSCGATGWVPCEIARDWNAENDFELGALAGFMAKTMPDIDCQFTNLEGH